MDNRFSFLDGLYIFVIGLSIGILTGLSTSPVLSIILTTLIATAGTIVAVFGGFGTEDNTSQKVIKSLPLALLAVAILIGAVLGMQARVGYARNFIASDELNTLLPPKNINEIVSAWEKHNIAKEDITKRIYEIYLPDTGKQITNSNSQLQKAATATLFNTNSTEECLRLQNTTEENLLQEMKAATSKTIVMYANVANEPSKLKEFISEVCGGQE